VRFENQLETATAPTTERARLYGQHPQRPPIAGPLWEREVRLIKAGGRPCARCKHRASAVPTGDPQHLRALCQDCANSEQLDRRVERQRNRRALMGRP